MILAPNLQFITSKGASREYNKKALPYIPQATKAEVLLFVFATKIIKKSYILNAFTSFQQVRISHASQSKQGLHAVIKQITRHIRTQPFKA